MLRVTLEMVPFGIHEKTHIIGTMTICNIGGTSEFGNYKAKLGSHDDESFKEVDIKHYPRKDGAWKLSLLALKKLTRDSSVGRALDR